MKTLYLPAPVRACGVVAAGRHLGFQAERVVAACQAQVDLGLQVFQSALHLNVPRLQQPRHRFARAVLQAGCHQGQLNGRVSLIESTLPVGFDLAPSRGLQALQGGCQKRKAQEAQGWPADISECDRRSEGCCDGGGGGFRGQQQE